MRTGQKVSRKELIDALKMAEGALWLAVYNTELSHARIAWKLRRLVKKAEGK